MNYWESAAAMHMMQELLTYLQQCAKKCTEQKSFYPVCRSCTNLNNDQACATCIHGNCSGYTTGQQVPKYLIEVVRTRHDGLDIEVYLSRFLCEVPTGIDVNSGDAWLSYIRSVIRAFLETDEGKGAQQDTCEDFNWGDLDSYIPAEFFLKYGITIPQANMLVECAGACVVMANQDELL